MRWQAPPELGIEEGHARTCRIPHSELATLCNVIDPKHAGRNIRVHSSDEPVKIRCDVQDSNRLDRRMANPRGNRQGCLPPAPADNLVATAALQY
jgi:hypothetical protein